MRNSSSNLVEFLNHEDEFTSRQRVSNFLQALTEIFDTYLKFDRLSVPFLETLDIFLGSPTLVHTDDSQLYDGILARVQKVVFKSKDIKKLLAAVKLYSSFASITWDAKLQEIISLSTKKLIAYLSHPFPMVRRISAEQLYMVLSARDVGEDEEPLSTEDAEELLLNTDWYDFLLMIT